MLFIFSIKYSFWGVLSINALNASLDKISKEFWHFIIKLLMSLFFSFNFVFNSFMISFSILSISSVLILDSISSFDLLKFLINFNISEISILFIFSLKIIFLNSFI